MDVDKNGVLTLSDYEEIAERMIQLQSDPSRSEEIRGMCRSLFQYFVAGGAPIDSYTQINEDEFIPNAAKTVSLIQLPDKVREVAKHKNELFFDLIDTNHSGKISREEYRKYLQVYCGEDKPEAADQAFDSIDLDGSGSISRAEFVESHRVYWFEHTSNQSNSPLPYGVLVDQ
ncbi:MAG: hypothetical protein F6J90_22285 [Moorea sp. SIOASIH]|nr:hypothetical protein [Moorena sp. SIOASIH]